MCPRAVLTAALTAAAAFRSSRNMLVKKAAKKAKILYKEDPTAKVCSIMMCRAGSTFNAGNCEAFLHKQM